jgi:hypothetical protein
MITPYNPRRGIDLYIDAAGEDDWDKGSDKYYIHGIMFAGPSPQWLKWMEIHTNEFGGMVHWSDGRFSNNIELPQKKKRCGEFIRSAPWLQTCVIAFHKEKVKRHFLENHGFIPKKYEATRPMWTLAGSIAMAGLIPHLKNMDIKDDWGCLNARNVVINNPKGGNRGEIAQKFAEKIGRTPEFVASGHSGIDALDGVLWSIRRVFELGKDDVIADDQTDITSKYNIVVCAVDEDLIPKPLRTTREIMDFAKSA